MDACPLDHPEVRTLLDGVPAADLEESGLADVTSPVFVVRQAAVVVAAAGYRTWPRGWWLSGGRPHRRRSGSRRPSGSVSWAGS